MKALLRNTSVTWFVSYLVILLPLFFSARTQNYFHPYALASEVYSENYRYYAKEKIVLLHPEA